MDKLRNALVIAEAVLALLLMLGVQRRLAGANDELATANITSELTHQVDTVYADSAGAKHNQRLRNLFELKNLVAGDYLLAVDGKVWQRAGD